PRLAKLGDEEGSAAGCAQRACDRLEAKAVSVGLDDRAALRRCSAGGKQSPIGDDRRKVDREHATGFVRGEGGLQRHAWQDRGRAAQTKNPQPSAKTSGVA